MALALPQRQQWQLMEELDPDISHFEFFLSKGPQPPLGWKDDDELLAATGKLSICLWGWPGQS